MEGRRWAIEESFETAKNELGLEHNETRSWHGWHRHVSLVMLAFAMVTTIRHKANHVAEKKLPKLPNIPRIARERAMNTLREAVDEYLTMRRGLGFKLFDAGRGLLEFVAFMEANNAPFTSPMSSPASSCAAMQIPSMICSHTTG